MLDARPSGGLFGRSRGASLSCNKGRNNRPSPCHGSQGEQVLNLLRRQKPELAVFVRTATADPRQLDMFASPQPEPPSAGQTVTAGGASEPVDLAGPRCE